MDIDIIFKIAAIGILVTVINMVLKKAERDEMALMTTLAAIVVVLLMVVNMISRLFNDVKSIFNLY